MEVGTAYKMGLLALGCQWAPPALRREARCQGLSLNLDPAMFQHDGHWQVAGDGKLRPRDCRRGSEVTSAWLPLPTTPYPPSELGPPPKEPRMQCRKQKNPKNNDRGITKPNEKMRSATVCQHTPGPLSFTGMQGAVGYKLRLES